jgi:hypothetical protein
MQMNIVIIVLCAGLVSYGGYLVVKARGGSPAGLLGMLLGFVLLAKIWTGWTALNILAAAIMLAFLWTRWKPMEARMLLARIWRHFSRGSNREFEDYLARAMNLLDAPSGDLVRMLDDPNAMVREHAIDELEKIAVPGAAEKLLEVLKLGRYMYMPPLLALGRQGDPTSVTAIAGFLSAENKEFRKASFRALALMTSPDAVAAFLDGIEREHDEDVLDEIFDAAFLSGGTALLADALARISAEAKLEYMYRLIADRDALREKRLATAGIGLADSDPAIRTKAAALRRQVLCEEIAKEEPWMYQAIDQAPESDPEPRAVIVHVEAPIDLAIRDAKPINLTPGQAVLSISACSVIRGDARGGGDDIVKLRIAGPGEDEPAREVSFLAGAFFRAALEGAVRRRFWPSCPDDLRDAIRSPLFRGIYAYDDFRDELVLTIDDEEVEVFMKHRDGLMSVGLKSGSPDPPSMILVLVAGMSDVQYAQVPPFVAEIEPLKFIAEFVNGLSIVGE